MTLFRRTILGAAMVMAPAVAQAGQPDPNRVIIKFREGVAVNRRATVEALGAKVAMDLGPQNAVAAHLPEHALLALRNNPNVEYVEPDVVREPFAQSTPYGIDMVQAPLVWPQATGAGRKVCIIDSGLYLAHEDHGARANITGYPAGWNTDACGHGTHVAGTIAAVNNAAGVVGVMPNAPSLHIVKVFGDDCSWTYSSTLVDALNRCTAAGANVVSMSLGGGAQSRTEDTAFANALKANVLSIAAAGNGGNTQTSYPAGYTSVVSVAAVDSAKALASFSQRNKDVELAAPGVGVLSTVGEDDRNTLTLGATTCSGGHIDLAPRSSGVTGEVVNGGLCDSVGAWAGKVVLCQRGTISFFDKVKNVQTGGGVAAVLYNNVPGGFAGTLGDGNTSTIPAISLSQEDGQAIVASGLGQSGTVVSQLFKPASGYAYYDGTSMATPHVSAVAALIWSYKPTATAAQVRTALQATAEDLGTAGKDNSFGYGLVRAKAALDYLITH